ncbi:carbohydrate ABC transporter permease [Natrarchaeobius chitinivorans]|uniref:Carbohydrate ABC transporter permease n=1 Tax=Natrarchaeobius chitinivorans TaxID=1679083 RepID=A0A3N6LX54_NATCH|nr:carbohydrate ABC transporter permease [Natrarchaeobius chitinivorans]RQG93527.1 carbohydrate ABC transporter permease [Natrarchaeobius chitinivorans]
MLSEETVRPIATRILIGLTVIVFGLPLYWLLITSFKPLEDIITYPPELVPGRVTLENYFMLFEQTDYRIWLQNSLMVAAGNIIFSVTVASFAGYSLARYDVWQRKNVARAFIFSYMFPSMMLGLPFFVIFQRVGLVNTNIGLILAHASVTLPFTTWIMWQFFQTVPLAWEESAWIMGASRFRTIFEVAMPAALPGIVACAIFAFAISWNDFTFAFVLISNPNQEVLTTGIAQFVGGTETRWNHIMVGGAFLVLPPFVVIYFLNKYLLEGFSVGGMD